MPEKQINLKGERLTKNEELFLVYNGSSFEGKMEMLSLINQLESTERVLNEVVNEIYLEKKILEHNDIKIFFNQIRARNP
jgi:hypothetical protein